MYIVRTYELHKQKAVESEFKVESKDKAISLADALFEATERTVKVLDDNLPFDNIVYKKMTPKDAFMSAAPRVRERVLMETAMRIMDLFTQLTYAHLLNPDKLDNMGFMEKLQLFCTWALEYEEKYYDTKEYNDFWLDHTEKVFLLKLKEEFG